MIDLRLAGDLTIAAFFAADKPKDRETRRKELAEKFRRAQERVTDLELDDELQGAVRVLKAGPKGVTPFHWELEFPEVFDWAVAGDNWRLRRDRRKPPFLGGRLRISGAYADCYLDWLKHFPVSLAGNADLVAYFFRRAFALFGHGGVSA